MNKTTNFMIQIRDDALLFDEISNITVESDAIRYIKGIKAFGIDDTVHIIGYCAIECFLETFLHSYLDTNMSSKFITWVMNQNSHDHSPEKMAVYVINQCKLQRQSMTPCEFPTLPMVKTENNTFWFRKGHVIGLARNYGHDVYGSCSTTLTAIRNTLRIQEEALGIKLGFYSKRNWISSEDLQKAQQIQNKYNQRLHQLRKRLKKRKEKKVKFREDLLEELRLAMNDKERKDIVRASRFGQSF
jgi:hypothetical protein